MVNGKNKGNQFERKISNIFSKRFEERTGKENSFRRNSDSGSFFGNTNQKRIKTHDLDHANFGDILTPKDFKFSIECKNYKTAPSLKSIISNKISEWDKWIKQAEQDAFNSNKEFMLIIKYNGVEELVLLKRELKNPIFKYNEYNVELLTSILNLEDGFFFD